MTGDQQLADLLDLPFDQYQRYRIAGDILAILTRQGVLRDPPTILDVGGYPGLLPRFVAIPGARTVVMDVVPDTSSARRYGYTYVIGSGMELPFPDGAFDLVISNSLLHHIGDPTAVLDEIARVAGPSGRVLLRDLRRPPRGLMPAWIAWHGRHYRGEMRRLYRDSVAAAFTPEEMAIVVRHSRLAGAAVSDAGPYLVVARDGTNRRGLQLAARPGSPRKPTPPPEERP